MSCLQLNNIVDDMECVHSQKIIISFIYKVYLRVHNYDNFGQKCMNFVVYRIEHDHNEIVFFLFLYFLVLAR